MLGLVLVLGLAVSSVFGNCENGWREYKGSCYFFSDRAVTFPLAQQECKDKGGSVTEILNKEKQAWIGQQIDELEMESAYIGGSSEEVQGVWKWIQSGKLFSDTYSNWQNGEPNYPDRERCVYIGGLSSRTWFNDPCNKLVKYICEKSVVRGCDEGWAEYGQSCISVSPEPLDWFAAAGACSLYGATLVRIEDQAKQNFVVSQLQARGLKDAWAGASSRYHSSSWLWIPSLKRVKDYTNWSIGGPDNSKSESGYGEQCLHLMGDKWNDRWCRKEMHFVCEKKA